MCENGLTVVKFCCHSSDNSIIKRNTNKFSTTNLFSEMKNIYIIEDKYEKDCLFTGEYKSNFNDIC